MGQLSADVQCTRWVLIEAQLLQRTRMPAMTASEADIESLLCRRAREVPMTSKLRVYGVLSVVAALPIRVAPPFRRIIERARDAVEYLSALVNKLAAGERMLECHTPITQGRAKTLTEKWAADANPADVSPVMTTSWPGWKIALSSRSTIADNSEVLRRGASIRFLPPLSARCHVCAYMWPGAICGCRWFVMERAL